MRYISNKTPRFYVQLKTFSLEQIVHVVRTWLHPIENSIKHFIGNGIMRSRDTPWNSGIVILEKVSNQFNKTTVIATVWLVWSIVWKEQGWNATASPKKLTFETHFLKQHVPITKSMWLLGLFRLPIVARHLFYRAPIWSYNYYYVIGFKLKEYQSQKETVIQNVTLQSRPFKEFLTQMLCQPVSSDCTSC